ncbi:MAG: insulinase family protein [Candidatus Aminicenantes bacterium]|nr:insulinase family protein [Candidatus Aminicenantes bacterium]
MVVVKNYPDLFKKFKLLIFLIIILGQPPLIFPQTSPRQTEINFRLENGLKVFLLDRPNSPLVNLVLAVGYGSRDEQSEEYGLAHFLEHLILFRGKRSRPVEEIHQDLKRTGGWINGHTSLDATIFELSMPINGFEEGLRNFIDLIFNLNLEEEDIAKEKEIILEEMNLQVSEPFSLAVSLAYEQLFPSHAYGHPVIGRPDTIKELSLEQVIKTHRTYYSPANCALAAVGDLKTIRLEDLIRKYFGPLRGEKISRPSINNPPSLGKIGRAEKELDEKQSHLLFACRAPDISSVDQYAFDLLTAILGRGINPLLIMALGSRRISVANVLVSYNSHRYSGVMLIYLILEPKNVTLAEREVNRWLRQIHQENFSPDDVLGEAKDYIFDFLNAAKKQIKLEAEKSLEDGLKLASSVALYLLLLEDMKLPPYIDTIDKMSSTDLRRVASKYLSRPEMAIVVINPIKTKNK